MCQEWRSCECFLRLVHSGVRCVGMELIIVLLVCHTLAEDRLGAGFPGGCSHLGFVCIFVFNQHPLVALRGLYTSLTDLTIE